MLGQNTNEGLPFTSPFISNDTAYDAYIQSVLPDISPAAADYIDNVLYPPPSNSTLYKDNIGRNALSISESSFICNTLYLDRAFGNQTYAYQFSVPPALHGQDIPYTFFNGPNTAVLSDATALALQAYITSFAENGMPSGSGIPSFPLYGNDSTILKLNATSIAETPIIALAKTSSEASDVIIVLHSILSILGVALTTFRRHLRRVRPSVRALTHTLHLPPAPADFYDGPAGPRPDWLLDVLLKLPKLQSLVVSQLPFFDHASLLSLRTYRNNASTDEKIPPSFSLQLLIANECTNTTPRSLADGLSTFPHLVFLDLSRTLGARDPGVLSKLQHMERLQIVKLCGIQLRDDGIDRLAQSIGRRVRSLDVRTNLLTDRSLRTFLDICCPSLSDVTRSDDTRPYGLSGAAGENWSSSILRPDPAVLDEFRDESFDKRYFRRLTQGPVSRLPSEDQPQAGITHLYIADNLLTVDCIASLVTSTRLHVLDAGAVKPAKPIHRSSSASSASTSTYQDCKSGLPGVEKLSPILAKHACQDLTSLRLEHSVVTKSISFNEYERTPATRDIGSDATIHELDVAAPAYEFLAGPVDGLRSPEDFANLPGSQTVGTKPEQEPSAPLQARRYSVGVAEAVIEDRNHTVEYAPVTQGINGSRNTIGEITEPVSGRAAAPQRTSSQLGQSSVLKQFEDVRSRQDCRPHGLLPGMLPRLRSLTLTDIPCYDNSGEVVKALIQFIRCCASEFALAKLQLNLRSKDPGSIGTSYNDRLPARQVAHDVFALRKITLEMNSPEAFGPTQAQSGSRWASRTPTARTKSSTEDADSEAFWAAQENDFSFFEDDPTVQSDSKLPLLVSAEEMGLHSAAGSSSSALPTPQQRFQADSGRDVVQELVEFRKERKAAYETALKQGHAMVEGYWPGKVTVVRRSREKGAAVDYYGNQFEKGYSYR
ncbi:MAG: hypothetical protein LQ348_004719, partial [Seirophora lacunosa]